MPVKIQNKTFTDVFGNSQTFYQNNAGDPTTAVFRLSSKIQVSSATAGTSFVFNMVDDIVTIAGVNLLEEGFRNGDYVRFEKFTSSGILIVQWITQVQFVSETDLDVVAILTQPDVTLSETMRITSLNIAYGQKREAVIVDVNHVQNTSAPSEFSHIDGEVTRFEFDLTSVTTSYVQALPVGNKSGQFATTLEIRDVTLAVTGVQPVFSDTLWFDFRIRTIQSGIYKESLFNYSNCLRLITKMRFQRIDGEPANNFICNYSDLGDTGWFDEGFNSQSPVATLVQGVTDLAFDSPSTHTFIVDAPSATFAVGVSYIPDDELYYKNQSESQSNLAMTIPSTIPPFLSIFSPNNPSGAGYAITVVNVVTTGTQHAVTFNWLPLNNGGLDTFMDTREETDRRFIMWAKFGNVNLIIFDGLLISSPPVGGELDMITSTYLDHSQNTNDATGVSSGFSGDIEDDIAYIGKFRLPYGNDLVESMTARIEALNTTTGDKFTLQSVTFDVASIPFVGGKFILNESLPVLSTLPNTSFKKNALFVLDSSIDDLPNGYGVKILFPFFYRWEYWLQQLNANAVFYPNEQTKNWLPYDTTADWTLNLHLECVIDNLAYIYDDALLMKPYDANKSIESKIELYIDATNQNVGVVAEGMLMRVVGTHKLVNGFGWNQSSVWGMITIEPKESSPRWICSSVVPTDYNISNPLTPLAGVYCDLTFPTPDVARLECYFQPNMIDLTNGVKFTSKIKGCSEITSFKMKSDGTIKFKSDGTPKIKS
jgi:hypothetical protein